MSSNNKKIVDIILLAASGLYFLFYVVNIATAGSITFTDGAAAIVIARILMVLAYLALVGYGVCLVAKLIPQYQKYILVGALGSMALAEIISGIRYITVTSQNIRYLSIIYSYVYASSMKGTYIFGIIDSIICLLLVLAVLTIIALENLNILKRTKTFDIIVFSLIGADFVIGAIYTIVLMSKYSAGSYVFGLFLSMISTGILVLLQLELMMADGAEAFAQPAYGAQPQYTQPQQQYAQPQMQAQPQQPAPKAFCTQCGNQLNPGQAFCTKCGAKMQ